MIIRNRNRNMKYAYDFFEESWRFELISIRVTSCEAGSGNQNAPVGRFLLSVGTWTLITCVGAICFSMFMSRLSP